MTKPIVSVNYGLGSVYENFIEINHKLPEDLRSKIISHEERHDNNSGYTKEDFNNDFQSKNSYFLESIKFSLQNIESFIGFFPFMYSYYAKRWTYNFSALFPFLWFGIIFSLFFFFLLKINIIKSFLAYVILFIFMNLIFIAITHNLVKKDAGFIYKERQ